MVKLENYNELVMKHFMHPKNMGEMKNADAVGQVGNPICGDIMRVYIKIGKKKIDGKEEKFIKDIKFQTMGCPAAIATSSVLTELAKGMSLEEASIINNKHVADALGGLPPIKLHCSNLAANALKKAIEVYKNKNNLKKFNFKIIFFFFF